MREWKGDVNTRGSQKSSRSLKTGRIPHTCMTGSSPRTIGPRLNPGGGASPPSIMM
jgi:hypothetical protein